MNTFEIVRGVEGDCLVLDGTRICGPKPWGGGRIIKTFRTDGIYEVIDKVEYRKLVDENAKLRELCAGLWSVMWACAEQRCPHRHEDCFVVNGNGDGPKGHGECWYERRMRELGVDA